MCGMKVYFDESGDFNPCQRGGNDTHGLVGVIIPENEADSLQRDFQLFVRDLPAQAVLKGEPKGCGLTVEHSKLLARIMNAHRVVTLVPVTLIFSGSDQAFITEAPQAFKDRVQQEAIKYLSAPRLNQVLEWARQSGNLSPVQACRLFTYAEGVFRAVNAIVSVYRCPVFAPNLTRIDITFDRVGPPNGREERVLFLLVYLWVMMRWGSDQQGAGQMKAALIAGCPFPKFFPFHFKDSATAWELQLVHILAKAWVATVQDYDNRNGYLSLFPILHRNTIYPPTDPLGLITFRKGGGYIPTPARFDIFLRMARDAGKLLPCPYSALAKQRWEDPLVYGA